MFTRQSLMDFGLEKESILPAQKVGHKVVDKGDSPNRRKKRYSIKFLKVRCNKRKKRPITTV